MRLLPLAFLAAAAGCVVVPVAVPVPLGTATIGPDGSGGGGHGGRPRVPGGSGCDEPGDVQEHPECRG